MTKKIDNLVVYVVTFTAESLNHREKGVLSLRKSFAKMVLVTKTGTPRRDEHIVVGAYPNPLGLLRLIGLNKIKAAVEKYIYFPSAKMMYVWKAKRILKKSIRYDLLDGKRVCLLTCVPHHDIALIGLFLKSEFPEIHWVVDWQDLWSYDEYYFDRTPKIYKKRLLNLEKEILLSCDMNVTTNSKAKAVLENEYEVPPRRAVSINHHFYRPEIDGIRDRIKQLPDLKDDRQINIGFLGSLFKLPKMPGPRVVEAVESVIDSGLHVKLHIFGDMSELARNAAIQSRNASIVLYPRSSHGESLGNIAGCDFLLLAMSELPNCQVVMNIKLPHYLLLGRPILAMVPDKSTVADIIRETGSGYVIPSTCNWVHELKRILQDWLSGRKLPKRNERAIAKYSWENISKQWVAIFRLF